MAVVDGPIICTSTFESVCVCLYGIIMYLCCAVV